MESWGVAEVECSLEFSVDAEGKPADVRPVSCPEPMVEPMVKGMARYGLQGWVHGSLLQRQGALMD